MDLPKPEAPLVSIRRWARLEPFNPRSSSQVMAYLQHKGYPIPKSKKADRSPTTDEDGLEKLLKRQGKGEPVLEGILRIRRLGKAISYLEDTYVGKDGRFHPTWTLTPKTGRISALSPNLTNQPQGKKREEVEAAVAVRETIVASPGFTLVEMDWRAMEAVLLGFFADDPDYLRLAKLDIYSYFVSHLVGKPVSLDQSDETLRMALSAIKKTYPIERDRMKPVILGRGYGRGPGAIALDLEAAWDGVGAKPNFFKEAKHYIEVYEKVGSKVSAWQKAVRMRAHKEGKLTNPFGFSLRFWEVFKWDSERLNAKGEFGAWVNGSEANEALSFLPQGTGGAMLKRVLLDTWAMCRDHLDEVRPLVPIHDALLSEIRDDKLEKWIPRLKAQMERKWAELGGLSLEVEVMAGKNWVKAQMKPWGGAAA